MIRAAVFLILFCVNANAQERYKWLSIQEIKFYDLGKFDCDTIDSYEKIPKEAKSISCKPLWESILQAPSPVPQDIIKEPTCYMLVVTFKNGDAVPFRLYPNQKALLDMRKGHFNVINLKRGVFDKFDEALKLSITCINDKNCNMAK